MNKNINNKKPTYIYALGGLEEIGKNTYVVEHDNQIIVIDAGIKFAPDDLLGINGMVANYQYLIDNKEKISALIVTHGHEDHIGGIPYLLKCVPIKKIIAPSFAIKLICKKLNEFKGITLPEMEEVSDENSKFKLNNFEIEFIRACHSIPDAFSIAITTPNGLIFESGDFRFDLGMGKSETNFKKLIDIRNKGLDVLLCETTNAEVAGFSESESVIFNNLFNIIKECPGRIFLSTFASNINRIQKVVEMALSLNRKICIIGKSMDTNIKISKKMKLIDASENDFIKPTDLNDYEDNEILVLLTGSQGEELAALNVMAKKNHPKVSLKPNDTVILSSNPIPGNYAAVEMMVDRLYKLGVTVVENSPTRKIHASGHATMQELQLLIHLLEPRWIFPIHGEYKMMRQMQKIANGAGIDKQHIIISTNGHKLQLIDGELSLSNIAVPGDAMYINGKDIRSDSSSLLNERKILSSEGVIELAICFSNKLKKIVNIEIATRGCFIAKDKMPLLKKMKAILIENLNNEIALHPNEKIESLNNFARTIIKSLIWKNCHKNPLIFANFLDYDFIIEQIKNNNYLSVSKNAKTNIVTNDDEFEIDDENETLDKDVVEIENKSSPNKNLKLDAKKVQEQNHLDKNKSINKNLNSDNNNNRKFNNKKQFCKNKKVKKNFNNFQKFDNTKNKELSKVEN